MLIKRTVPPPSDTETLLSNLEQGIIKTPDVKSYHDIVGGPEGLDKAVDKWIQENNKTKDNNGFGALDYYNSIEYVGQEGDYWIYKVIPNSVLWKNSNIRELKRKIE